MGPLSHVNSTIIWERLGTATAKTILRLFGVTYSSLLFYVLYRQQILQKISYFFQFKNTYEVKVVYFSILGGSRPSRKQN